MQLEEPGQPLSQYNINSARFICNTNHIRLKYIRNDHLFPNPEDRMGTDFVPFVKDYDVIVANTGCHVSSHSNFTIQNEYSAREFGKIVNGTNKYIIYRTTAQPHPFCTAHGVVDFSNVRNLKDVQLVEFDEESPYNSYQWYLLPQRDRQLVRTYKQHISSINFDVLDIFPMTSLRRDGHRAPADCLHYFLPTVVDSWIQMFYNMLVKRFEHDTKLQDP